MKYKNGLVKEVQEIDEYIEHQNKLKEKLNIAEDSEVIIVEKKDWRKFLIRLLINTIKTVITIALLILAIIGLFILLHPELRNHFTIIFNEIITTIFYK